jgi:hypothetical protein
MIFTFLHFLADNDQFGHMKKIPSKTLLGTIFWWQFFSIWQGECFSKKNVFLLNITFSSEKISKNQIEF